MTNRKIKEIHHPVTNGTTKWMVLISIIFLAVLATLGLVFAFTGTYTLTGLTLWGLKGSFIGFSTTCVGGLIKSIISFFDNREAEQKAHDKLERIRLKKEMKHEKLKLKLEKYKIKKGVK